MKALPETTLITGCTSGVGFDLAHCFARKGHPLVLVAPDPAELQILATELRATHGATVHAIVQDLREPKAVDRIHKSIAQEKLRVDVLVNSAADGQRGKTWEIPLERDLSMIRLNIEAVVRLTKRFLPAMVERGRGKILNIASMPGFDPGPLANIYHATKAFISSFSEALSLELEGTGVRVTALCPGPMEADFFPEAEIFAFRKGGVRPPADVAETAYTGLMDGDLIVAPDASNTAFSPPTHRLVRKPCQAEQNEKRNEKMRPDKQKRKRGPKEIKTRSKSKV